MGVVKNEHGVYQARKLVPKGLREAVAQVVRSDKPRISWLKRSLKTKELREANIRAKPVLVEFDQILAKAEHLAAARPQVADLDDRRIKEMAEYHYATILEEDEQVRQDGDGSHDVFVAVAKDLVARGISAAAGYEIESQAGFGLTEREFRKIEETTSFVLPIAEAALARGDLSYIADELDELLEAFRINLDKKSAAYRRLGLAVLRADVRALRAIAQRNNGEPVETPSILDPDASRLIIEGTGGLREAFEGWKKQKKRSMNTLREYENAIGRFLELHGDLPVAKITRRHVREFREALQEVPLKRTGALRKAPLPELQKWGKEHSADPKLSSGTINKLLGGCQAVAVWARDNGLVPEDQPWSDPFARMRLEEAEPTREPWELNELRLLFSSPVFAKSERPLGGRGEAAFWLPLLALFTGARLGELAPLLTCDVIKDEETGITVIRFVEDEQRNKRLKTASSRRTVPLHPELKRLGFLDYVTHRRSADGDQAALFPLLTVGPRGSLAESWSKWFGRYIRSIGISNPDRVFHSFRHSFKDALRAAGVGEDINDALTGHSGGGVGRSYGAKSMERRFGLKILAQAVAKVAYPRLDLSLLCSGVPKKNGK